MNAHLCFRFRHETENTDPQTAAVNQRLRHASSALRTCGGNDPLPEARKAQAKRLEARKSSKQPVDDFDDSDDGEGVSAIGRQMVEPQMKRVRSLQFQPRTHVSHQPVNCSIHLWMS